MGHGCTSGGLANYLLPDSNYCPEPAIAGLMKFHLYLIKKQIGEK